MDDTVFEMMYRDSLLGLSSGYVDDISREVLSHAPLPENYVEPFISLETEPQNVMEMTHSAMTVWIGEAEKSDYFSSHFVRLSRMIMDGTVTMARGLMSLHNRGEDLSRSPMSIEDLIRLGSRHFRKSYLGVIQTVKSYPEISCRLLMNQLGWANTLLRLFRTKERLEKPVVNKPVRDAISTADRNTIEGADSGRFPAVSDKTQQALAGKAYSEVSAVFEPGSFTAPRAYSSLDGTAAPKTRRQNTASCSLGKTLPTAGTEEIPEGPAAETAAVNSDTAPVKDQEKTKSGAVEIRETASEEASVAGPKSPEPEGSDTERTSSTKISGTGQAGDRETDPEEPAGIKTGHPVKQECGRSFPPGDVPRPESPEAERSLGEDPGSGIMTCPVKDPPCESDIPIWMQIMKKAFSRETPGGDDNSVTFTEEEIRILLDEPDFCAGFPDIAEALRRAAAAAGIPGT